MSRYRHINTESIKVEITMILKIVTHKNGSFFYALCLDLYNVLEIVVVSHSCRKTSPRLSIIVSAAARICLAREKVVRNVVWTLTWQIGTTHFTPATSN